MSPANPPADTSRKREALLSKDGKWLSFPKTPYLLQYVPSGKYFGRIKLNGKIFRTSLETDAWTVAKLRLVDFLKQHQENHRKGAAPLFSEAVDWYKQNLESETGRKNSSKEYRLRCLLKIQRTWPELWNLRINEITATACREWATKLSQTIACHFFNNTIGTLRLVLETGATIHKEKTGEIIENPAEKLKRTRVLQKELRLPESQQFKDLLENLRTKSGSFSNRIGDLVEFLAYSGLRINSEAIWVTWEDIDWERKEIVIRGHPETGTKNSEIRRVPLINDMEGLLTRLKSKLGSLPSGRILQISECQKSLNRACKELGIHKLTHHDLRHLFATRCIEAGVDIPTVSRWLGHKDGGALAMRTYGHLRNEHSRQMAERVKF